MIGPVWNWKTFSSYESYKGGVFQCIVGADVFLESFVYLATLLEEQS